MKKWLAALLLLCLGTGCAISSLAWQRAERQSAQWRARAEAAEHRANEAESALKRSEERRLLLSLESDPIAAFFTPFPYSGSTAGYLAALEAEAYRTEMENAAALLRGGTDSALIDSFLAFIDAQAQMEAEIWTGSLRAPGRGSPRTYQLIEKRNFTMFELIQAGEHTYNVPPKWASGPASSIPTPTPITTAATPCSSSGWVLPPELTAFQR